MKTNILALMLMAMFAVVGCSEEEVKDAAGEAGSNVGGGVVTDMIDKGKEVGDGAVEKAGDAVSGVAGDAVGDKVKDAGGDAVEKTADKAKELAGDK